MIRVENLRKEFFVPKVVKGPFGVVRSLLTREGHTVVAVDGVSFAVQPGEFVGYIGPNGAGKSTSIKMMTGILHPTSGTVQIAGVSPQMERTKVVKNIGVVFGQRTQLWWDLPLGESFELLAVMYKVPRERYKILTRRFDELLGLGEFWDTPVRKLSLGQRMRGDICAALLHEPAVLFLDEPTIGLDVVAKNAIRGFLQEINQQGVTILLTTHDLADVERLCKRVMVINHGRLLFDGDLAALRQEIGVPSQLIVDFECSTELNGTFLPEDVQIQQVSPTRVVVSFDRARHSPNKLLHALDVLGVIKDIHIVEPEIEAAVAKLF